MNKKLAKILTLIMVMSIVTFFVAACGGNTQETAQTNTEGENGIQSLIVAIPEEIQGTDIQQIRWETIVHSLLFDPFVIYDLDLNELLPATAESFSISEDGTELTFVFAEDLKFANGNPLTVEAIKESMERYIEISPYNFDYDPIEEIIIENGNTVILRLDSSAAFLWPVLASTYSGIVDGSAALELGDEAFNRDAVGNGAFTVGNWVQGSHVTLLNNPHYQTNNPLVENKGPFKLDEITVRFIPENFTRVSEIEAGNVDIAMNVPIENLNRLKNNQDIELHKYLQAGIDYIAINTNKKPLDDLNVRTALALAIDKEEINQFLQGTVHPTYGLLSAAQIGYDEETEKELENQLQFNLDKAKSLLAESGWEDTNGNGILEKDGEELSFTMLVALDAPALKQAAPVLQSQLRQIGVNLELREYESSYVRQMVNDGDFELATRFYSWSDADILYYVFHSSAGLPWSNPKADQLLDEARYLMNMEERIAKYSEAQQQIMSEIPAIPLFAKYQYMAVRKNVKGLVVGSNDNRVFLNDVTKEQ